MRTHRRWVWFVGAAALGIGGVAAVVAQERGGLPADGSLAALTSEVRQLREAVQDLSRKQAQGQALTAYLAVQHTRVTQAASRLDEARSELESLTIRARELSSSQASVNESLGREVDPARRAEVEEARRQIRLEQASVA
jgi:predicted  nucleic acid-binding Zn-ribbon protein